jgi:tetratricopeptide (TPR) repeat protein
LRKVIKYFLIVLAACVIVVLLFSSCKARRTTVNAPDAAGAAESASMVEMKFGYLFIDGCSQRMKGNLQEALQLFEECRKIKPDDPALNYELGTLFKLLGQNDMALLHAKQCASSDATNEWYQLLLVECLNSKGQYAQAIKIRESLMKQYPERSDFKEDLAIEYAVTGQYEKSFRIYEELEKNFGVSEQLTLNKVRLLKSQKKYREVEAEFQKLIATNPREPRFYAYLAEFYLELNSPEKAKTMYDKILEVDAMNATVHLALHDFYSSKGDTEKAYSHLKLAFVNPDLDANTKAGILGNFYRGAENGDQTAKREGTELAELLLKAHPEVPASNALYGDFLMLDKRIAQAAPYYFIAAMKEAREPRIWENLLFVENELGRFDSLEKHSRMAVELFPTQARHYLYHAVALNRAGKQQEAVRTLEDGFAYVGDDRSLNIDFLRLMGDIYHQLKNYAKSDKAFDDALKINTDDAYVLNNYAYYLSLRNEHLEKAERLSKKANQLQPGNRNYMDTHGWILFQQKRYADAVEWLSKAASAGPPNATIIEHYGDALFRAGKSAEALKQWQAAKEAGGNSPELLRKLKEKNLVD